MKLTKDARAEIIASAVKARFKDDDERLLKARSTLADYLYESAFAKDEAIALQLPKGWINPSFSITIKHDDFVYRSSHGPEKPMNVLALSRPRLEPEVMSSFADSYSTEGKPRAIKMADAIVTEHKRIYLAKEELKTTLNTLLYSVNTLAKLREVWPEGEAFFPAEPVKQFPAPVPHELTLKINSLMGIRGKKK